MTVWLFKDGEFLPIETGGRRMRMGMLAKELVDRGHEVHWFSSTFLHLRKELHSSKDCVVQLAPNYRLHLLHAGSFKRNFSYRRHAFYRRYATQVARYCEGLPPPDRIVCAFPLIDVAAWAVDYGRRKSVPVVVDVRDTWPDSIVRLFPPVLRPVAQLLLKADFRKTEQAFAGADRVVAVSSGMLLWALEKTRRPLGDRVIPLGFPDEEPEAGALPPALQDLAGRYDLFVYVGTFGHTYDLAVMVEAARLLAAKPGHRAHFVLVGTGPLYDSIAAAASKLPNVTLTGWLDQASIRALLRRSAAGILPWAGLAGAMPNKFFDYLSMGLPVISSAAGELNEQIRQRGAGLVFDAGDAEGLARAVDALACDHARRDTQAAVARSWFVNEFSETTVYRDYADLVESLASPCNTHG